MDDGHARARLPGWHLMMNRILEADRSGDPQWVLREATELITQRLGSRGSCILFGSEATILICTEDRRFEGAPFRLDLYPEVKACLATGEPLFLENVKSAAALVPLADTLPKYVRSLAFHPMMANGVCQGLFLVRDANESIVTRDDREISAAAAQLATHLCDARDFFRGGIQAARREPTPVFGVEALGTSHPLVLVVEDDTDMREYIRDLLMDEGYRVCVARSGREAREVSVAHLPDAILLDVGLPDISGFEAAGLITEDRPTRTPSIIFVSGAPDLPAKIREQPNLGGEFLQKPFERDELLVRLRNAVDERHRRRTLSEEASTDELTGLGNLRLLRERLIVEASRVSRYHTPLSIVVADLDGLKAINDQHGHLVGSEAIQQAGRAFANEARESDVVIRYGGDEFMTLLPHTTVEDGAKFAERVLERIRSISLHGRQLTASAGVAGYDPSCDGSMDDLIARADAATYTSKRLGRNMVSLAPARPLKNMTPAYFKEQKTKQASQVKRPPE